jgi:bifunctional non-homologous end joining protein LigD
MGVSVPLAWEELPDLDSAAHWTVANIADRLAVGNTPWDAMEGSRTGLRAAMQTMGYMPQ